MTYDDDEFFLDEGYINPLFTCWRLTDAFGWTWLPTMPGSPEVYSLFDANGELIGHVYQRFDRVICWAPYTWAEEAYRSQNDVGRYGFDDDAQRLRHFERIGVALCEWVNRKQKAGVDLPLLRDTHAYFFETGNGIHAETMEENEFDRAYPRAEKEEAQALTFGGWKAVRNSSWCYEAYRLRDRTGQLRGQVQIRYGVVRAVAAQREDADEVDPLTRDKYSRDRTCRGQIVLQEKSTPMAIRFPDSERDDWIEKAIAAIEETPNPDRSWPPETLGAKGTERQIMLPTSPRDWK